MSGSWKYFIYLSNRLAQKEISPATAKDYIGAARSFIRNRWEEKYIGVAPEFDQQATRCSCFD